MNLFHSPWLRPSASFAHVRPARRFRVHRAPVASQSAARYPLSPQPDDSTSGEPRGCADTASRIELFRR